jgi:hypothetical protein
VNKSTTAEDAEDAEDYPGFPESHSSAILQRS